MATDGNGTTAGRAALHGIPTISDTFNPNNQGTDWPMDAYTAQVSDHQSPEPISRPAANSYAGDGNMEALSAHGLKMFTGAAKIAPIRTLSNSLLPLIG
jgi:hypothetical protein